MKVPSLVDALIEEEEEEDPCAGKQCTANEHCCDEHVCVDVDEDNLNPGKTQICPLLLIYRPRGKFVDHAPYCVNNANRARRRQPIEKRSTNFPRRLYFSS